MKILLTIFCVLMVLFGGGCAIVLVGGAGIGNALSAAPFALLPGGVAALNIAVLAALWGKARPAKWAFVTLVILDALVVLAILIAWGSFGLSEPALNWMAALTAAAFAAKGILTAATLKEL